MPFALVKAPPTKMLPSACTERALTSGLLDTGRSTAASKLLSTVPSGCNLARPLLAVPFKLVKSPPTRIEPSGPKANAVTFPAPLMLAMKLPSRVPSALRSAIPRCLTPPTAVKLPPTRTFLSGRGKRTGALFIPESGSNSLSKVPSSLRRARPTRGVPWTEVKEPAIINHLKWGESGGPLGQIFDRLPQH